VTSSEAALPKDFERVKSVALWTAPIKNHDKDHKSYGLTARKITVEKIQVN
jgi:hypothetical protein